MKSLSACSDPQRPKKPPATDRTTMLRSGDPASVKELVNFANCRFNSCVEQSHKDSLIGCATFYHHHGLLVNGQPVTTMTIHWSDTKVNLPRLCSLSSSAAFNLHHGLLVKRHPATTIMRHLTRKVNLPRLCTVWSALQPIIFTIAPLSKDHLSLWYIFHIQWNDQQLRPGQRHSAQYKSVLNWF